MINRKSKKVNSDLKEGLLAEGGTLTEDNIKFLNNQHDTNFALNESEFDLSQSMIERKRRNSDGSHIDGLKQFDKHSHLFQELTKRQAVDTTFDVVSMVITYDSKHCISIVTETDEQFYVQGYDLDTSSKVFEISFEGEYLKMNLVEQTLDGKIFALAYQNNGKFYV